MSEYIILRIPKIFVNLPKKDAERIIMRELAIRLYQKGMVSLGKAAEMINLSIAEFIELLSDERVPIDYDDESLMEDLEVVDKLVKNRKK